MAYDVELQLRVALQQLGALFQRRIGLGLDVCFAGIKVDPVNGNVAGAVDVVSQRR
jgi:hypothetical protein